MQTLSPPLELSKPDYIEAPHYQEWLDSAVDPAIIAANVKSLQDGSDYILYSEKLQRRNDGRLNAGTLKQYSHLQDGGWWVSGLNPIDGFNPMLWGTFKPDNPRQERKQGEDGAWFVSDKSIKYEVPAKVPTSVFCLRIPSKPQFWADLINDSNQPLIITEGAKKAGCLLSLGWAAIGIPGVTGAVRTKDKDGNQCSPYLIPEIKVFCQKGRPVHICFDHDAKPKTVRNVNREIFKLARLLESHGCKVKIVSLPGPEKGVDDPWWGNV